MVHGFLEALQILVVRTDGFDLSEVSHFTRWRNLVGPKSA